MARLTHSMGALVSRIRETLSFWMELLGTSIATLSSAALVAAIVHVVVIFGVVTAPKVNPRLFDNLHPPLEVVLVNARSEKAPLHADVLAQHNLDGGGTVEEDRQARSPLPVAAQESPMSAEAQANAHVQALEQQTQAMLLRLKSDYRVPDKQESKLDEPRPPTPVPAPSNLAARSLEMARLQARVDQQWDDYQKRPRRLFVGARAQEYAFAQYVDDWRVKVERIGNLNYPEAAKQGRVYGSLILTVSILANGNIDTIEVEHSSGHKVLDAAAVKIVELSGPFPPFPEGMRKKVDILGITRTWTFTRSDQLTSQ